MISFNKIVKSLSKKGGKILLKRDIYEIIDPEEKREFQKKVDITIYRLKSEGIIISLKSGVYLVPSDEDRELNSVDLMDKYFLQLLKKYIILNVGNQYLITGKKALEIHLKNYSLPEKIYIINRNINKKVKVGNYEIIFKTISGKYQGKKINLFSKLYSFSQVKNIESIDFKVTCLEHALLETLLVTEIDTGLSIEIVIQAIKKYGKIFNDEIFKEIGKYKYIMSYNRLKEISKHIDKDLNKLCLDIIKKNGGLFIGEGLRGI